MGFGTYELLIILAIIMVLFGASRIPALGKGLGQGLRSFKDALKGGEEEENAEELPAKAKPAAAELAENASEKAPAKEEEKKEG